MVMSKIEKEQGCTLSKIAETTTSGKSQEPSLLISQRKDEVAGIFLRITIITIKVISTPIIVIIFS